VLPDDELEEGMLDINVVTDPEEYLLLELE